MLLSAPLIIPPYEIMQLQTSIRSCEGNHYVVTVINDAAQNSGLLSNNPRAQGAFEGPVAKETDDIQNGATVHLSSLSPLQHLSLLSFLLLLFPNQLPRDLLKVEFFWGGGESLSLRGVWRLLFNFCMCLYRFHKVAQILACHISHMCISCVMIFDLEDVGNWLGEYCFAAWNIFSISPSGWILAMEAGGNGAHMGIFNSWLSGKENKGNK